MEPLSRAKLKLFTSLKVKKYRFRHEMFWVEGKKMFQEAYHSGWPVVGVVIREDQIAFGKALPKDLKIYSTDASTFQELNSLQHPEGILTIIKFPSSHFLQPQNIGLLPHGSGLILDRIQDPGNLGTLIRTADWFGIEHVILSQGCADALNPKTLRSTMGAIFRVNIYLAESLKEIIQQNLDRVWLADMEGQSLEKDHPAYNDFVVIGNEANGVSHELRSVPGIRSLTIPGRKGSESLNAAIAGGIIAWELSKKRQN